MALTQVKTDGIAADAVTGAKIADDQINSEHYVDGSIDNAHVADDQIDSEHYVAGSIDLEHMSANSVDSDQYVDNSINAAHIANDAIDSRHYAADSIDAEHIADNSVLTQHIANANVTLDKMASEAVDEDNLKISNAGSNGQYLQKQSGNTGGLTWATVSTDLVDDTSPQLGGDLDVNGHNILLGDSSNGADDDVIKIGAGADLNLYHDGTNSWIVNKTGYLTIRAKHAENGVIINPDAGVELYYDNSKKLETTSGGVHVTGSFYLNDNGKLTLGTGGDLEIYHDGTDSYIDNHVGTLSLRGDSEIIYIKPVDNENSIVCKPNAEVEICYNNSTKFETASHGVEVIGKLTFSGDGNSNGIELGADADLNLYHDNSNAYIDNNVGHFYIRNDGSSTSEKIFLQAKGGEHNIACIPDGGVELYNNNSKVIETSGSGLIFNGPTYSMRWPEGSDAASRAWEFIGDQGANGVFHLKYGGADGDSPNEASIKAVANGSISLYYDNSEKIRTTSTGFKTIGNAQFDDDRKVEFGDGQDLKIYHDATHSWITNATGTLVIEADTLDIRAVNNEHYIEAAVNGGVDLFYNNVKKFETTNDGITMTGNISFSSGNNGLYLGGGTGSNHLNDYEKGTFTPVVKGSSSDGSWSTNNHAGLYVKVGQLVFISVQVSGTVGSAGSGDLEITSLPFATTSSPTGGHGQALALGPLYNWDVHDSAYQVGARVQDNNTMIKFWANIDNSADSQMSWPFGSSGTKYGSISGCYSIA